MLYPGGGTEFRFRAIRIAENLVEVRGTLLGLSSKTFQGAL